jgi:hypothetical protein
MLSVESRKTAPRGWPEKVIDFARKPMCIAIFLTFWDSRFGRFVIPSTARFAVGERTMSQPRDDRQDDLFRPSLNEIINLRHLLVRLAGEIDWDFLAGRFSSVCDPGSRHCRP